MGMDERQVSELLLQAIELKKCDIHIFEAALKCAVDRGLREELEEHSRKAVHGADVLENACFSLGMDPDRATAGRRLAREIGNALVDAMQRASVNGASAAAQLVACECLAFAENKERLCRVLLAQCGRLAGGEKGRVIQEVCVEMGHAETSHVYRFMDWSRELWMEALGLQARLPPSRAAECPKPGREAFFSGKGLLGGFLKDPGLFRFPGLQFRKRNG